MQTNLAPQFQGTPDGVEAEANIATLTCPDFVTLRHEQLLKQVTNDSLSPGM